MVCRDIEPPNQEIFLVQLLAVQRSSKHGVRVLYLLSDLEGKTPGAREAACRSVLHDDCRCAKAIPAELFPQLDQASIRFHSSVAMRLVHDCED